MKIRRKFRTPVRGSAAMCHVSRRMRLNICNEVMHE
jgi:hypothetical protein